MRRFKPSELSPETASDARYELVEVYGTVIVSGAFTHVVDEGSSGLCLGLLLNEVVAKAIEDLDVDPLLGTSVFTTGKIIVRGGLWQTGYPSLPFVMSPVYDFDFENDEIQNITIKLEGVPKAISIFGGANFSAKQLSGLRAILGLRSSAMSHKKELNQQSEFLLFERLEEDQAEKVKKELEVLGFKTKSEYPTIGPDGIIRRCLRLSVF